MMRSSKRSGPTDDLFLVRALADVATVTVLQHRSSADANLLNFQLRALHSRITIKQAEGIVAQGLDIPLTDAFTIIRNTCRRTNTKLVALCDALITATIRPPTSFLPAAGERRLRRPHRATENT